MDISIDASCTATSQVPFDRARAHLHPKHLERILRLFPRLRALTPMGGSTYLTELEPMGVAGISHVVSYACRYQVHESDGVVSWASLDGRGNARMEGRCEVRAEGNGTRVSLQASGVLREVEVPMLARPVVNPYIKSTFDSLVKEYVGRLVTMLKE